MAKKRIQVTISQEMHDVISSISNSTGASKSRVIADLLEASYKPLVRMAALLESAKEAPREVKSQLADTIESVYLEIAGAAGVNATHVDRAITRAEEALGPPSTNRGVKNSKTLKNKGKKKMAKKAKK